jgi:hypothetical protein
MRYFGLGVHVVLLIAHSERKTIPSGGEQAKRSNRQCLQSSAIPNLVHPGDLLVSPFAKMHWLVIPDMLKN